MTWTRLRPLLVPAILTLAAVAILVSLGNWQVRRLTWKEALIASATERPKSPAQNLPPAAAWPELDISANEYRPFRLTGRFLHDKEALVFTSLGQDSRGPFRGPGFWVVTPFGLDFGGTVLVNRGFVPEARRNAADRGETPPTGRVTVKGLLRPNEEPHLFTPDNRPEENIFYTRNVAAIPAAKNLPAPVAPFTIDLVASETPPGGLPQAGETRMLFSNNHLGYAITWYGLALAALAVFGSFAWGRLRPADKEPRLTPPGPPP